MPPKRGSRDLAVPDITEDAAERKRVLNVLAQRRYRTFHSLSPVLSFKAKREQESEREIACRPSRRR